MSEHIPMDSSRAVAALAALAHATRLAVFRLLVQRGPAGLPAGVIAQTLGVPPSSLTFHVQHLVHAGLLSGRRQSRQLIYAADFAAMNALLSFLSENCCGRGTSAACGVLCTPLPAGELPAATEAGSPVEAG
jgi:DNA-binding transcriptional ArsR family regulator